MFLPYVVIQGSGTKALRQRGETYSSLKLHFSKSIQYLCLWILKIVSDFFPTGAQPEAIRQLVKGLNEGLPAQTLLGVTGSGKTFTVANVIEQIQKPTLVLSHNKTLAAQLYSESQAIFP